MTKQAIYEKHLNQRVKVECNKEIDHDHYLAIMDAMEEYSTERKVPNNGWIKIESEKDLPKVDFITQYWFYDGESRWIDTVSLSMRLGKITVTHYQPIQKPEPPLF